MNEQWSQAAAIVFQNRGNLTSANLMAATPYHVENEFSCIRILCVLQLVLVTVQGMREHMRTQRLCGMAYRTACMSIRKEWYQELLCCRHFAGRLASPFLVLSFLFCNLQACCRHAALSCLPTFFVLSFLFFAGMCRHVAVVGTSVMYNTHCSSGHKLVNSLEHCLQLTCYIHSEPGFSKNQKLGIPRSKRHSQARAWMVLKPDHLHQSASSETKTHFSKRLFCTNGLCSVTLLSPQCVSTDQGPDLLAGTIAAPVLAPDAVCGCLCSHTYA
jgi:hypothetical protein